MNQRSPITPAAPKKRHHKTAEDWAQLIGKREGGRSFCRSQSSQTNSDHSDCNLMSGDNDFYCYISSDKKLQ
jgi:hypothetical protein